VLDTAHNSLDKAHNLGAWLGFTCWCGSGIFLPSAPGAVGRCPLSIPGAVLARGRHDAQRSLRFAFGVWGLGLGFMVLRPAPCGGVCLTLSLSLLEADCNQVAAKVARL